MAKTKGAIAKTRPNARRAIVEFCEKNLPKFDRWISEVAGGIPKLDENGNVIKDVEGSTVWVNRPDPAMALKIVNDACEYHIPKLSRAVVDIHSVSSQLGGLSTGAQVLLEMSPESLLAHLTAKAEPLPQWLRPSTNIVEGEIVHEPQLDR